MSSKIHHSLAMLPLLSLMAISPSQFKPSGVYRSPAQAIVDKVETPFPKYEMRAKKVDLSTLAVDKDIKLDAYMSKSQNLLERLGKEKKSFKKDIKKRDELDLQQNMLNEFVLDIVIQDVQLHELVEKKSFAAEQTQKNMEEALKQSKSTLEYMLTDFLANESSVQKEETVVVVVAPEPNVEDFFPKVEIPKVEVVVKVEEPKKEEPAKADVEAEARAKKAEDEKVALEKRLCEIEDKNKALLTQVTNLVTDQRKIIDIMLSMQQQMLQRPAFTPYYAYPQVQQPIYQYQYQPQQDPQYSLMPANYLQSQSMQPNYYQPQAQQQSLYNPQSYTEYDPRYSTTAKILPGAFGDQQFGFNFGQNQYNQQQPQIL